LPMQDSTPQFIEKKKKKKKKTTAHAMRRQANSAQTFR